MRWILVATTACLMAWGVANANAGEKTKAAMKTSEPDSAAATTQWHKPLNNVIKMDATGKRTALCCCGAEFTVTDNAPTLDHDRTLFYMCGEGCKEMALKATPEENAKTMVAWHKKYDVLKMADNTYIQDGKTMATCVCGRKFAVTDLTPYVTENGVKLYLCSEDCNEHIRSAAADQRMAAEMKVVKAEPAAPMQTSKSY
jgi:hypothetical protein